MSEMWRDVGWPALRKNRLAWFLFGCGIVALYLNASAKNWMAVGSVIVMGVLYLLVIMLTEMLERTMGDLKLTMEATEPIMASLVYEKQRADAIADLIRLYESQGKYGIPTDVLLTEMNKVEKKAGRITSITVVPMRADLDQDPQDS